MDFQPFFVTCVTCASRLRVNRQELVGTIVACPKCQSMVQLTPPKADPAGPTPVAVGTKLVDSGALTEDSISKPELPDLDSKPVLDEGGFAVPPPVFKPQPAQTNEVSDPSTDQSAAPPPNWHSQRTAKSRQIAMTVAVVLGSLFSALILFGVLSRNRPTPVTEKTPPPSQLAPSDQSSTDTQSPTTDSGTPADATSPDGEMLSGAETPPETPPLVDPPVGSPPAANDPTTDTTDPLGQRPGDQTGIINPSPPTDLLTESPLLSTSPLDGMSTLESTPFSDPANPSEDAGTLTELPKDLQGLFSGITAIDRPQFTNTQPAPQTIDQIQLDRAANADINLEVAIDKPEAANMRQALGLNVALQTSNPEGYPLNDLMLFLSQLSGVPIELDWISFDIVAVPISQRVKLPKNWPTIEEILTEVCDANGATFETNDHSVMVRPSDERFNQAVSDYLDLSDLAPDTPSAVLTARTLLGQTEGDSSTVSVPTELGPAQLAVFVCESIRRARGVAGKMPDEAFQRWAGTYQDQIDAWPVLKDGVSGTARIQASTLAALLRQVSKLNAATCYVHWPDARQQNVSPIDKVMPKTGDAVSAADAFSQAFQHHDLTARVVDPNHWWIGSDATFDRLPVVVRFDADSDAQTTLQQVELILRSVSATESILGSVAIDSKSKTCIAVLPRYLLRQLPRVLRSTSAATPAGAP